MQRYVIEFHGNEARIVNGPPGATRVVQVPDDVGRPVAHLYQHFVDMLTAQEYLTLIHAVTAPQVATGLFEACIGRYFKCFQRSGRRDHLRPAAVFAAYPDLESTHRHFRGIRNKFLMHDENGMTGAGVGAIIVPTAPEGPVAEVMVFGYRSVLLDQVGYDDFYSLVSVALGWVQLEFERRSSDLKRSLNAEGLASLESRATLQVQARHDLVEVCRPGL